MNSILHATFANARDGIHAVESLVHHGVHTEEIDLILPLQPEEIDAFTADLFQKAAEEGAQTGSVAAARNDGAILLLDALLPKPPELSALFPRGLFHDDSHLIAPDAPGYRYDALGAVLPDRAPSKPSPPPSIDDTHRAAAPSEEGAEHERLEARSIPGLGLVAGSGRIATGLRTAGSLAESLDNYLIGQGIDPDVASEMSDQLAHGGTALSVAVSDAAQEAEIALLLEGLGGHLLH